MNSQHKKFPEVIKKLGKELSVVFGMDLACIGKGKDNLPCLVDPNNAAAAAEEAAAQAAAEELEQEQEATGGENSDKNKEKRIKTASAGTHSYILVSMFPSSVFDSSLFVMARRDPEADYKKSALFLILTSIFMLNRAIDEGK